MKLQVLINNHLETLMSTAWKNLQSKPRILESWKVVLYHSLPFHPPTIIFQNIFQQRHI